MAVIQHRGKRWRALVRVSGHPTTSKTFSTRIQAKRWADRTEDAIKAGSLPAEEGKRLFAEVVPEYLAELWQRDLATEDEITNQLNDWCKVLGGYALVRITSTMIAQERNRLAERVGPATVNRRLASLSAFFKWVVRERKALTVNPVSAVRKMKEPRHRIRYLSGPERERLFAACKKAEKGKTHPALYPLVVVACYSGMRQGELLKLEWKDVDLSEGWATVKDSKNGEARTVPILGPALEALREWRGKGKQGVSYIGGRVFACAWFPTKAWHKAVASAMIEDFSRFHDLRHTAASYLVQSGAELADVAEILGHKDISMSRKYAHLSPKRVAGVMKTMVEQFS